MFLWIAGKKNLSSSFGKIEIANSNHFLSSTLGPKISPFLLEKLVYIGQLDTYEQGADIASRLLGIQTNDTAIFRLTDGLGAECEAWLEEDDLRSSLKEQEVIYAQVDGSMVLTREDSWKEIKLGRVFGSSALHEENPSRNWLKDSEYIAHLGQHKTFEIKMSKLVDEYEYKGNKLVFINDGAKWQWNWIEAEYPNATQVLDFYHAMEHIGNYLTLVLTKEKLKQQMECLGSLFKEEGLDAVLSEIKNTRPRTKTQKEELVKLEKYLINNRSRMDYPNYLSRGLLIGSGAIESAHRTVIQRRMKLSGQRWSKQGAQRMLNLRTLNMSGYWGRLVSHLKNAA